MSASGRSSAEIRAAAAAAAEKRFGQRLNPKILPVSVPKAVVDALVYEEVPSRQSFCREVTAEEAKKILAKAKRLQENSINQPVRREIRPVPAAPTAPVASQKSSMVIYGKYLSGGVGEDGIVHLYSTSTGSILQVRVSSIVGDNARTEYVTSDDEFALVDLYMRISERTDIAVIYDHDSDPFALTVIYNI